MSPTGLIGEELRKERSVFGKLELPRAAAGFADGKYSVTKDEEGNMNTPRFQTALAVLGLVLVTTCLRATENVSPNTPPTLSSATAPALRSATFGATPQEIHAKFSQTIEKHLSASNARVLVSRLNDQELEDLAKLYTAASPSPQPLLNSLATNLDAKGLMRISSAFGASAVSAAVRAHASPAIAAEFNQAIKRQVLGASPSSTLRPMGSPNLDMTINEVYLEFRTAPVGSVGPAAAIAETAMYAGTWLSASAWAGWEVGGGINYLIDRYNPQLGNAIGGTVAGMVDQLQNASNWVQLGLIESGIDDQLGNYITGLFGGYGDYGVSDEMGGYYEDYGYPCGRGDKISVESLCPIAPQ